MVKIEASPPREYRAVHKETKEEYFFNLVEPLGVVHFTNLHNMDDFYPPDLWTGHFDSNKAKVFGGDVFIDFEAQAHIYRIYWREQVGQWWCVDLRLATELCRVPIKKVIGNIHNPAGLPEEVRRLLKDCRKLSGKRSDVRGWLQ